MGVESSAIILRIFPETIKNDGSGGKSGSTEEGPGGNFVKDAMA